MIFTFVSHYEKIGFRLVSKPVFEIDCKNFILLRRRRKQKNGAF